MDTILNLEKSFQFFTNIFIHKVNIAYDRVKIILSNSEPLIRDAATLLTINHELTPDMITNLINNKYPYINY